ncbi:hypothetical protein [Microbacterium aurum]
MAESLETTAPSSIERRAMRWPSGNSRSLSMPRTSVVAVTRASASSMPPRSRPNGVHGVDERDVAVRVEAARELVAVEVR